MPAVDIGTNPYTALIDKIPGVGKFINDYLLGRTPQDQMTNTLAPTYIKAIPVLSKGLLKIGVDSAKPEVLNLLKNSGYGELRGLISTKGQTAFWDAGKALHQPIADELNLLSATTRRFSCGRHSTSDTLATASCRWVETTSRSSSSRTTNLNWSMAAKLPVLA